MDCRICNQQQGEPPVGGYVYEDAHWYANHAPPARSVPGQLLLMSRRHLLDPGDMQPAEAESYGPVLGKLTNALKQVVDAERVYTVAVVEATPHLHVWVIPRAKDSAERGTAYLTAVLTGTKSTEESEATRVAEALRGALGA